MPRHHTGISNPGSGPTRCGFTLIELLVVVSVIGVLLAVLLPALTGALAAGRKTKESFAAKTLMQSYIERTLDNDDELLPAYLPFFDQGGELLSVKDEYGNDLDALTSRRWAYRLAPYFDYEWAGTTHVSSRADALAEQSQTVNSVGSESWAYDVTVFPSLGLNYFAGGSISRYIGRVPRYLNEEAVVRKRSEAVRADGMGIFYSTRFLLAGSTPTIPGIPTEPEEGYLEARLPALDAVYNEGDRSDAFGNLHPRHAGTAVIGFLDGHVGSRTAEELLDARLWSKVAQRRSDADWRP